MGQTMSKDGEPQEGWGEFFPLWQSQCYLVHLDRSLGPLQCYHVGLLEPLGDGFLKPLVEVSQSKGAIPGNTDTRRVSVLQQNQDTSLHIPLPLRPEKYLAHREGSVHSTYRTAAHLATQDRDP